MRSELRHGPRRRRRLQHRKPTAAITALGLLLGLLLGLVAPATGAAANAEEPPPPSEDPFYTPPEPLPDGEPGEVLRQREVDVRAEPFGVLDVPVRAWQLLYRSTSATGEDNAVSATLLLPGSGWSGDGDRPLLSYAVGTHGIGDHCAPSYALRTGTEQEVALLAQALSKGWAVVVTDYEGLGTPGTHTYATGRAEGPAVLDAARAAQRADGAGLSAGGPVGIAGYSQGGQAAAFAAELHPRYAPELDLVGAAPGGVPADLVEVAEFNERGPAFGLVLGAALGLANAYQDVPFEDILNDRGERTVQRIEQSCTAELGSAAPFGALTDYTTMDDPLNDPAWQERLAENRAGQHAPQAPLLLYHGTLDELIPYSVGRQLRDRYCELGAGVQWAAIPLAEHIGGVAVGGPMALEWLDRRFAGVQPRDSC
ncbi:Secretory lipase [Haloechinothrix alba]|uniref:Secretory lipase n=1 Tax=Haloechinothrix alba TaxID=664784 RepID=A0A238Z029_9PSEU|nr:lipase family protein [Haloechinothrix alba]SNR76214.1 Secretory lipase [Haloechinothrix alba]